VALVPTDVTSQQLAKIGKHKAAIKRIRRLVDDYERAVKVQHVSPSSGWLMLVAMQPEYAQKLYTQRTSKTDHWTLKKEVARRGLEVIRDVSTPDGPERLIIALVPVDRMTLKQLRGVVQELHSGALGGAGAPTGL